MAEIPLLELASCESLESEKNMGTQKISVTDRIDDAFQCSAEKSDSFVIDMDAFSPGINKDSNTSSRITLQRSLSRNRSQRWGDKKVNGNTAVHDWETVPTPTSPKAPLVGSCTPERPGTVGAVVGSTGDNSTNPQVHHQISITTTTTNECRLARRNSFRRSSNSWVLDPKRVLLFFATLSSMGTMLLIYFTLTISKQNADD